MTIYSSNDRNFLSRQFSERYCAAGLNIIPIRCDGSRSPRIKWQPWINNRYPSESVAQHFTSKGRATGIAIVCGHTSGNLEVLDFDLWSSVVFPWWSNWVEERSPGLLETLPIVATPKGGRHVYWRSGTVHEGKPLAQVVRQGRLRIIIETRGHGHYVIAPGSPAIVHPLQRPYQLIQGDLTNIAAISPDQREVLLWGARYFNRHWPTDRKQKGTNGSPLAVRTDCVVRSGDRPGDRFNATANWPDVLEPHGWTIARTSGELIYWRKPGSYGREHHATTGHNGRDTLHVFSSSAAPFEPNAEYNKFAAYTLLNHGGDFRKAARQLKADGFAEVHLRFDRRIDEC